VAVDGVEVVAEPGQVQGDLVGDLGGTDPADGGIEVPAGPRLDRVRGGKAADRQRTTFREGNLRRSGRGSMSVTRAVTAPGYRCLHRRDLP